MISASRPAFEKIVVITRETRLEGLKKRFNTTSQAKFYVEQQVENYRVALGATPVAAREKAAEAFKDYQKEEDVYEGATDSLLNQFRTLGLEVQVIDRALVPTYLFTEHDIVITLGQDGLVANCAKYAGAQPIIGVNPDPARFDGLLLPYQPEEAMNALKAVLHGNAHYREVTLAEARLNDGQKLLAFNDLFIGPQTHVSARYRLSFEGRSENQSSSGIIVSTGAGSTGWLSSVFNMAAGIVGYSGGRMGTLPEITWEDRRLCFAVREPFRSQASAVEVVAGMIDDNSTLELESQMPTSGVIFSDGVESDFLAFNSGSIATIAPSDQRTRLVVPP